MFLFFFMEETNYHREVLHVKPIDTSAIKGSPISNSDVGVDLVEETTVEVKQGGLKTTDEEGRPDGIYGRKSYVDKLKVFEKRELQYPSRLRGRILRPLIFLSFPVIFYAGFSYGSSLIWFNVLNGTASLILSGAPYNFSSTMVGLAYISPLIGVALG